MAVGASLAFANALMNAGFNATSYAGPAQFFVKLHNNDPGAAGTANVVSETTRIEVLLGTATTGAVTNTADVIWPAVAGTGVQTYTHFSLWTASTGGTFMFSGTLGGATPGSQATVNAGAPFTIDAGEMDIVLLGIAA